MKKCKTLNLEDTVIECPKTIQGVRYGLLIAMQIIGPKLPVSLSAHPVGEPADWEM